MGTIFYLRAPGMTMFRMPIFTWNMLVTGILILIAFPVLTAAVVMLFCDRHFGTIIYTAIGAKTTAYAGHPSVPDPNANGSPELWQNLFWFFGHPEVYILALPYFGIVTEVLPVFSRKPVFGYKGMVFATMAIAALSTGVWAHHMFTTGVVLLPFFSLLSLLIAVPTGIKFFNWIGTMWRGQLIFTTPMLFCIGFLFAFLMGGVTGVMLASPPIDFFTHDTYFVVAHFHQVLIGTTVFAGFGGLYYWYPKMFGRMLNTRLGKWHFWVLFIGFWITFMPQYVLGLKGMPRRVAHYPSNLGWNDLNMVSTIGAFIIAASFAFLLVNLWISWRRPVPAGSNPWDAHTLEWFTTSPPPHHNFTHLPPIRSERPTWDYNHPDAVAIPHGKHALAVAAARGTPGTGPAATVTARARRCHEDRIAAPDRRRPVLRRGGPGLLVPGLRGRRHHDAVRHLPAWPAARVLLLLLAPAVPRSQVLLLGQAGPCRRGAPRGPSRRHHPGRCRRHRRIPRIEHLALCPGGRRLRHDHGPGLRHLVHPAGRGTDRDRPHRGDGREPPWRQRLTQGPTPGSARPDGAPSDPHAGRRCPGLVALMAVATGAIVANLYYAQPLLHEVATTFHVGTAAAAAVITCTQVGYAAGLILVVPLGDLHPRRTLVLVIFCLAALSLVVCALAPRLWLFQLGSVAVGCASVGGQVMIPFAADLADPARRGRVVARLMTGLLTGILLARTVSGRWPSWPGGGPSTGSRPA